MSQISFKHTLGMEVQDIKMVILWLVFNLLYAFPKFLLRACICFLIKENDLGKKIKEEDSKCSEPSLVLKVSQPSVRPPRFPGSGEGSHGH